MAKGNWKSFAVVLLIAAVIIAMAYYFGSIYHQKNLTKGDSIYTFYIAGNLIQIAKGHGLFKAIQAAVNVPKQETVLHFLSAAMLGSILPVETSIGIIINSFWYLVMAVSLTFYFWKETSDNILAILLPIPMLIAGLPLIDVYQGLSDLHVNLLGYTIGVSIVCLVMSSDFFCNSKITILAGIMLGILILGRFHSVFLISLAIAPYIIVNFFSSRERRKTMLKGLAFFLGIALLISGWWISPRLLRIIWKPINVYGVPGASIGNESKYKSAWAMIDLVTGFFFYNIAYRPLAFVLSWIGGVQIASSKKINSLFKRVNWFYIWMGISPLLVLILMRTDYQYYGWPALFGLYLSVVFPFGNKDEKTVGALNSPVFRIIFLLCLVFATIGFGLRMASTHSPTYTNKQNVIQAVDVILENATRIDEPKSVIIVGMAFYGEFNPDNLANVFLFEKNCRVDTLRFNLNSKVPDTEYCPDVIIPANFNAEISEFDYADYVIILSPDSWQTEPPIYPDRWPKWVELSKELYESDDFEPLTSTLTITPLEKVIVLKRVYNYESHGNYTNIAVNYCTTGL